MVEVISKRRGSEVRMGGRVGWLERGREGGGEEVLSTVISEKLS